MIFILVILTLLILTIVLSIIYLEDLQDQRFYEPFIYDSDSVNVEEFFDFYTHQGNISRSHTRTKYDGPGVYVIYNRTMDKYYFGQDEFVIEGINEQLTSDRNHELREELSDGHRFYIKMMLLEKTSCQTLDELEETTREEFLS